MIKYFYHGRDKKEAICIVATAYIQEPAPVGYNYTGVTGYKDYRKLLNINAPLDGKYFLLKPYRTDHLHNTGSPPHSQTGENHCAVLS